MNGYIMPDSNLKHNDAHARDHDKESAQIITPPYRNLLDEKAPIFEGRSTQGSIALDQYRGQNVLLFFHPADFTPVCTTEFIRLAQRKTEFDALNTQLIGVSVDSIYSHIAWVKWIESHYNVKIDFPIVEDISMTIARAYGLVHNNSTTTSGARVCCFINSDGIIKAMIHYPMQLGRSVDELLRVQRALVEVERTGMTCPVDWHEGDNLLKYPAENIDQFSGDWLKTSIENFKIKWTRDERKLP